MPVEVRDTGQLPLLLGIPEHQKAFVGRLLTQVCQSGPTLSRGPITRPSAMGDAFSEPGLNELENEPLMTVEFARLFDSRFVVILQEHLLDRRFVSKKRTLPRTQVGQVIILDGTTGDWRAEGLSTIRYVPVWALVRKHIQMTYDQLSSQGRAAAYCTIDELEEAYLKFGQGIFQRFETEVFPGDEYCATPKQINESLQYVKSKLASPFTEVISVPTPYFINAAPGQVFYCPSPSVLD
ncbi:MAG: hypothetical protein HUU46_07455 [Candidatus Hydrogenedentes bacterium]|nr:hypothetical protein [Candidatus Hydrogenedentota bacterium]